MGSNNLLNAYKRARFLRRVMLYVFVGVFIATVLWAIPWLHLGLSVEDYNSRLTFLVFLSLIAAVTAMGAFYLRDVSHRMEQTLLTWSSVHDGLGELRRREFFYERIVVECQRAGAARESFAVFDINFEVGEDKDAVALTTALQALEALVHEDDRLAALAAREIGALAPKVDRAGAKAFAGPLRTAVADALAIPEGSVRIGWALFEADAGDAGSLVGIARARAQGREAQPDAIEGKNAA